MTPTLDIALLQSVASQMMGSTTVKVGSKTLPVIRTSVHRLKTVTFEMGGSEYQAIQQNPEKPSRWGKLARAGHLGSCSSTKAYGLRQRWRQASAITFGP